MLTLLLFILILSFLVFVHELGHFTAARRLGVGVEEFGFGFPPRLFGIRRGSTIFSLNWIPFGGFVKLRGESGDVVTPDSFAVAPARYRALILAAGVLMNFAVTIIFLSLALGVGVPTVRESALPGAKLGPTSVIVTDVLADSPAATAGFKPSDRIESVNGVTIADDEALRAVIASHPNVPVSVSFRRDSSVVSLTVTPRDDAGVGKLGIGLETIGTARYPIQWAVVNGVRLTGQLTGQIIVSFGDLFRNLLLHQSLSQDVSGPIGIAVLTGQVSKLGIAAVIQFIALLSLSLAVINVLPFPALDGGRLLFLAIEKIRGKAVNARTEGIIHNAGFALLLLFIVTVSVRDVQRFSVIQSITNGVRSLFGK